MPGLLTVGVPYVAEAFAPRIGGRAMGYYVSALVIGGLIGRVGVALVTALIGWRLAIGGLAGPSGGRRDPDAPNGLPVVPPPLRSEGGGLAAVGRQLRNPVLLGAPRAARQRPAVRVRRNVLLRGLSGSRIRRGRLRRRRGEPRVPPLGAGRRGRGRSPGASPTGTGGSASRSPRSARPPRGVLLTLPAWLPTLFGLALALITVSVFTGVTNTQIGVTRATRTDRGVASALYFSLYYLAGAAGAYSPGLAWQTWGWGGVAAVGLLALALAAGSLATASLGTRGKIGTCRKVAHRRETSRRPP